MKFFIVNIGRKLFMPTSALMIIYCIFYQYIKEIPYYFVIKLVLAALLIFHVIGWLTGLFTSSVAVRNDFTMIKNCFARKFYQNSYQIVIQLFCYYFAIYLVFMLDKLSVFFNYLIILLFGILLGYRIASKAILNFDKKDDTH